MIEQNKLGAMRLGSALLSVGVLGLLAAGSALAADYVLEIQIDDQGCPTAVIDKGSSCDGSAVKDKVCAKRNDKLVWRTKPADKKFELYFDPLKRGPGHKGNGEYSAKIDEDAPVVEYKYTVVTRACPDKPHDPRIVIRPN